MRSGWKRSVSVSEPEVSPARWPQVDLAKPKEPQPPGTSVIDREIRLYVECREMYELLKKQMEDAKSVYEDQKDRLWDVLEANGLKTVNHDKGRFTRGMNTRGYVKNEKELEEALEKHGLLNGARTLMWRQKLLNSLAKEGLDGDDVPGLYIDNMKRLTYTPRVRPADEMEPETSD